MKRNVEGLDLAGSREQSESVIVSVAFPYAPVGPKAVGGAEVFCSQMEKAVGSLGFRSVVVAHAESQPSGRLYATEVPAGVITDELRVRVEAAHQNNLERALAENRVALVHMHGLDFQRYSVPEHIPVLVTLHLPPSWYPESIWSLPRNYHLVCVSESQLRACPPEAQQWLSVISNGVELPDAALLRDHGRYALMLARICPEKNVHAGLDAARLAGIPSLLGGAVFPYEAHEQYFASEIAPRLTFTGHAHQRREDKEQANVAARFLGPVSGEDKARALSRAACLLLPSLAPETSSLVAMEALSFGVPVIGMAVGAVPEIVEHGRTGFLIQPGADAVQQMATAISRIHELDRKLCRKVAEERFPWTRTQDAYATLFRELALRGIPVDAGPQPTKPITLNQTATEASTSKRRTAVEQITSDEELRALTSEWIDLWRSDPNATPFQHPAWLLPWWEQFGPDGELHALTLRSAPETKLIGFLPLYTYQQQADATCKLLLMGAGTTDYLDGLWRSSNDFIAETALKYANSGSIDWEEQSLDQIRKNSPLARAASRLGLPADAAEPTSTLDLAKSPPAKIRNNIRRYRRLATSRGSLHCSVASSRDEARAAFDELVTLHTERWQSRGEPGVLQDPRVLAHHCATLPLLLEAGLLCMFRLHLEEHTVGVLYGLLDPPHVRERRLYLYLVGFSAHFAALSPGTLLLDEAWRYATAHGCSKLDLLRGGEDYKHLWGAQAEPTFAVRSRSPKTRTVSLRKSIDPTPGNL